LYYRAGYANALLDLGATPAIGISAGASRSKGGWTAGADWGYRIDAASYSTSNYDTAFSANSGQFDAGATTTASSFLPAFSPFPTRHRQASAGRRRAHFHLPTAKGNRCADWPRLYQTAERLAGTRRLMPMHRRQRKPAHTTGCDLPKHRRLALRLPQIGQ